MQIDSQWDGTCVTCDEPFVTGDRVNWEKGVGSWHLTCATPRNIKRYRKDVSRRSPLEPYEFGDAPPLRD